MERDQFRRAVANYCPTIKTHYGKWTGNKGNLCTKEPLPLDPIPERFGLYLISPGDDKSRIGVLDFDNHGRNPVSWDVLVKEVKPIFTHFKSLGHSPLPFRSTGGSGLHLWFFWDKPQDAESIRKLLIEGIELHGFSPGAGGVREKQVEIFPKQDSVPSDGWGACIDPPLAGSSCPLDLETLSPTEYIPLIVTSKPLKKKKDLPEEKSPDFSWNEEMILSALEVIPADDYDDWITVLRSLKGASVRAKIDARGIAEEWSKRSGKHIEREFNKKWDRGFPKESSGKGRSLGTLYWLAEKKFGWERPVRPCSIEKIRIQDSQPKLYLVTIVGFNGNEIPMRSNEINSKTAFVNLVLESTDQIVPYPKIEQLNELLKSAERIEADEDATVLGQFKNQILAFLDETLHPDKEELRMQHRSWRDEENNKSWFKWRDLDSWLRRQRHYNLSHSNAYHMIRLLEGGKGVVNLEKYGKQPAWWVPFDPREQTPEPGGVPVPSEVEAPF